MNYVVYNRGQANQAVPPTLPYIRISITDGDKDFVPVVEDKDNLLCSLKLKFWDVEDDKTPAYFPMSQAHALKIIEIMEKYKSAAWVVVINCEGGLSRSAAIAAALSKIYEGTDEAIIKARPFYNKYIYRTILETYEGLTSTDPEILYS